MFYWDGARQRGKREVGAFAVEGSETYLDTIDDLEAYFARLNHKGKSLRSRWY